MKKVLLFFFAVLACSAGFAQTTVKLKINHKLGSEAFAMNKASQNDLTNDFNVTRLEYYISGVSIVHDGGQVSNASDVYILVNAGQNATWELGSHNVTNIESINFSIGVDPGVNNQDPAQWPNDHALAPKSPSMHWGWQAGYRFVALEGNAGASLNTSYQLHALGNQNYFQINIPTSASDDNGDLMIELNADYNKAISGIAVSSGIVVHGDFGEAKAMLENFRDHVFTSLSGVGNTLFVQDVELPGAFTITPNPTTSDVTIGVEDERFIDASFSITDLSGRVILSGDDLATIDHNVQLAEAGIYFATLVSREGLRSTQKFIVQ